MPKTEYYFSTKSISVKGSVAVKLVAVLHTRNGAQTRLRLVDRCMTLTAAQAFYELLQAGAAETGIELHTTSDHLEPSEAPSI